MAQGEGATIRVTENGPYEVEGSVPLARQRIVADENRDSVEWEEGEVFDASATYRLCRCGQSKNKPFCDDSHLTNGFDGTESASRIPYLEQAEVVRGPRLTLTDVDPLCASARFCHPGGGVRKLAKSEDPDEISHAIFEVAHCPSGRLMAWDPETGEGIEPHFEPSIGLIDDPGRKISGPIWVRGGIPVIGSNGEPYEVRNRMTLCRCGGSSNKPFCDGTHEALHFKA
jgi:CDGSH-type Zn-finger protein